MIKLRHLAAASAVVLSLAVAVPPASAQWIVYDPTNFSQNVLTAARELQQINQMVEGLASKLKSNPQNADGWARLLRSRMVLEQRDQAARDLVSARKALAGDQAGLAQVNAVAREVGVPGA